MDHRSPILDARADAPVNPVDTFVDAPVNPSANPNVQRPPQTVDELVDLSLLRMRQNIQRGEAMVYRDAYGQLDYYEQDGLAVRSSRITRLWEFGHDTAVGAPINDQARAETFSWLTKQHQEVNRQDEMVSTFVASQKQAVSTQLAELVQAPFEEYLNAALEELEASRSVGLGFADTNSRIAAKMRQALAFIETTTQDLQPKVAELVKSFKTVVDAHNGELDLFATSVEEELVKTIKKVSDPKDGLFGQHYQEATYVPPERSNSDLPAQLRLEILMGNDTSTPRKVYQDVMELIDAGRADGKTDKNIYFDAMRQLHPDASDSPQDTDYAKILTSAYKNGKFAI